MNSLFCPTNPPPLASPPARWPFVSAAGRQAPCPNQQVAPPRPKNQNRKPLKLLCFARAPHAHLVSHLGRDPAPQCSFSPSPQPKRPESSASARAQNCEETVVAAHGPFRCHLSAGERVGDLGLHNSTRKASCLGNTTTGPNRVTIWASLWIITVDGRKVGRHASGRRRMPCAGVPVPLASVVRTVREHERIFPFSVSGWSPVLSTWLRRLAAAAVACWQVNAPRYGAHVRTDPWRTGGAGRCTAAGARSAPRVSYQYRAAVYSVRRERVYLCRRRPAKETMTD
jgi:hypothetical protein